jgi:hypothetical protein
MSTTGEGSVTRWLGDLKSGGDAAAKHVWGRYSDRLVRLARRKLQARAGAAEDEEDAALSAFDSFCRGAAQGRYPRLDDRDDLWRLLVVITVRKAHDLAERENAQKRGGGGLDLHLMPPVKDVTEIPTKGRALVIVAAVGNLLHIRLFDHNGSMVVDTDEVRLTDRAGQVDALRKQLVDLWPPHALCASDKARLVSVVTSIVGHVGAGRVVTEAMLAGPDGTGAGLDDFIGREPSPELAAMVAELYRRLRSRLKDDSLRLVLDLILEGYSRAEIAERMGCTVKTVSRKLDVIRTVCRTVWLDGEDRS